MKTIFTALKEEINAFIHGIELKHPHDYSKIAELSIRFIGDQLINVQSKFDQIKSLPPEEEIFYFKHIKSHFLGKMQFYVLMQEIEFNKPPKSQIEIKKYYLSKLYWIKKKLHRNRSLYSYFKANNTSLDQVFFLRPKENTFISTENAILEIDKSTSTAYVHLFAELEALERLRNYLKAKVKSFQEGPQKGATFQPNNPLIWTGTKAELIELMYSLYEAGVFKNGRADLKEIAECFQKSFAIDLGDYHRTFQDIRNRKKGKTKFLDSLVASIQKKIQDAENQLTLL